MSDQVFFNGTTVEELAKAIIQLFPNNFSAAAENVLMTREETCSFLSINKTTLNKHTKSGKLKSYGIGNRVYYKRNEVLEAIKPLNH